MFRSNLIVSFACLVGTLGFAVATRADDGFRPLFDGKTLNGWHTTPGGTWQVKDGMIVGTSPASETNHGLLVTDKQYSDFTVRFKFRVLKGNSGFYFRSEPVKGNVGVNGFQAEVDNSNAVSGLYETGGRAWVKQPDAELIQRIYKPEQWNEMTITAEGRDITVKLNGQQTVALENDPGRTNGVIALQLHGGMDMEVMFKDLEIRPSLHPASDDSSFKPMFNGKDLTGWQTTGNWIVEEGGIVTLKPREGETGWQRYSAYLTTNKKYKRLYSRPGV